MRALQPSADALLRALASNRPPAAHEVTAAVARGYVTRVDSGLQLTMIGVGRSIELDNLDRRQ